MWKHSLSLHLSILPIVSLSEALICTMAGYRCNQAPLFTVYHYNRIIFVNPNVSRQKVQDVLHYINISFQRVLLHPVPLDSMDADPRLRWLIFFNPWELNHRDVSCIRGKRNQDNEIVRWPGRHNVGAIRTEYVLELINLQAFLILANFLVQMSR